MIRILSERSLRASSWVKVKKMCALQRPTVTAIVHNDKVVVLAWCSLAA